MDSTEKKTNPLSDTVAHVGGSPSTIPTTVNQSFNLNYSATESREIIISLFSETWSWLASNKITVAAGSANRTLSFNLPIAATAGTKYQLKIENRPVGAAWNDPDVVQSSVTVTAQN